MSRSDGEMEDRTIYKVVVNHEEQYSIWAADRENPLGWKDVGKTGLKAECLAYIKEVWTDMRPLSLRKRMEEMARRKTEAPAADMTSDEPSPQPKGDDLVQRLSQGKHPVEVSLKAEKGAQAFKDRIDRGYVHIKFTDTKGGTELGVKLDPDAVSLDKADFNGQMGIAHLEGSLTLNFVKVRCIADIDLKTLTGQGHLLPAEI